MVVGAEPSSEGSCMGTVSAVTTVSTADGAATVDATAGGGAAAWTTPELAELGGGNAVLTSAWVILETAHNAQVAHLHIEQCVFSDLALHHVEHIATFVSPGTADEHFPGGGGGDGGGIGNGEGGFKQTTHAAHLHQESQSLGLQNEAQPLLAASPALFGVHDLRPESAAL